MISMCRAGFGWRFAASSSGSDNVFLVSVSAVDIVSNEMNAGMSKQLHSVFDLLLVG